MASFSLLLPLIDKICNRNPYITHEPINHRHQSLEYKLTVFSNLFFGYDNNILSSVQFIRRYMTRTPKLYIAYLFILVYFVIIRDKFAVIG